MNKTPKIRFEGFSDDWEEQEFLKVFELSVSNNTLSRAELNYENGKIKNIHYGDILVNYSSITDITKTIIPFITNNDISKYKNSLLRNGDIIIADTAEDETTGKATEIAGINSDLLVSGLHTIVCRPINGPAQNFMGYYMNSASYRNQLLALMQGVKVLSISKSNLIKTSLCTPGNNIEQTKIGDFFKNIDSLSTLKQSKHDKLVNVKKAMLEKMFPKDGEKTPQVRFDGFCDDWEEYELGEVAKITTGYPFNSNYFDSNGEYLVITNGNIQNHSSIVDNSYGNRINIGSNSILNEYILTPNEILVTMDGTVGRTAKVVKKNQILAQRVGRLTAKSSSEFLYQFLNTGEFFKNMTLISHGGTIKHISLSEISDYISFMPLSKSEQTKIGNFFKKLDNLIELEKQELEKLKNIKKSCLEKMFV